MNHPHNGSASGDDPRKRMLFVAEKLRLGYLEINLSERVIHAFLSPIGLSSFADFERARSFEDFISHVLNEDHAIVRDVFESMLAQRNERFRVELRMKDDSKEGLMVSASGVVLNHDAQGRPMLVVGMVQSIRDQQRLRNDLKESELRFRRMFDQLPIGAFVKDPRDWSFSLWNESIARITGFSAKEALGQTDFDLFPHDVATAFRDNDERVVREGITQIIPSEKIVVSDGCERVLRTTKVPVLDSNGRVVQLLGLSEDITEQERILAQLQQAQKMEAVGRLAGGVAHDFNNLLTAMIGFCGLARRKIDDPAVAGRYLERVHEVGEKAQTLVRQLLTFSRSEDFAARVLDPNRLIQDLTHMLTRLLGEHIQLEFRPQQSGALIQADAGQIEQLLMNLCINARDAMPRGGRITIETNRSGSPSGVGDGDAGPADWMLISVRDTGTGISAEDMDHIFEPFYTTKDSDKGTGLGLATVYAVVQRHGGIVTVSSELGAGSEFQVYLPMVEEQAADRVSVMPQEELPRGDGLTVLLAEDDNNVRRMALAMLESVGYRVYSASNGKEAIQQYRTHADEIDLLVFDVVMPVCNGRDAYDAIRSENDKIPVLFCSGYNQDLLKREFLVKVPGRLLDKPYTQYSLLTAMHELLVSVGKSPLT